MYEGSTVRERRCNGLTSQLRYKYYSENECIIGEIGLIIATYS